MDTPEVSFGLTEEQRQAKEEEQRNVALVEIQLRDEHSFPALGVSSHEAGGREGPDEPADTAEADFFKYLCVLICLISSSQMAVS